MGHALKSQSTLNIEVENLRFQHFGAREGLNEKIIYSATQDELGIIWIGTSGGLYRFDGNKFSKVKSQSYSGNHLVVHVYYDQITKSIWAIGYKNIFKVNTLNLTIQYPDWQNQDCKKLIESEPNCIQRFNGKLYLGIHKNSWIIMGDNFERIDFYNLKTQIGQANIYKFMVIKNRLIGIANSGLYFFDVSGREAKYLPIELASNQTVFTSNALYHAEGNALWFTTYGNGLVKVILNGENPNKLIGKAYQNSEFKYGYSLYLLGNKIWVEGGTFDIESETYKTTAKSGGDYALGINKIVNVFKDVKNNLWFCSYTGLAMASSEMYSWKNIELKEKETGYFVETTFSTQLNDGRILIGNTSTRGLGLLKNGNFEVIATATGATLAVCKTASGKAFAASYTQLYEFDTRLEKLIPIKLKTSLNGVYQMHADLNGMLYLNSENGGVYVANLTDNSVEYLTSKSLKLPDETAKLALLFIDKSNNCWFASNNLVLKKSANNSLFKYAIPNVGSTKSINDIQIDQLGNIWVASITGGLFLLEQNGKNQKVWINYNSETNNGLPDDFYTEISMDSKGILWVTSTHGIVKWDPFQRRAIGIFTKQNGLIDENGGNAVIESVDGSVIISTYAYLSLGKLNPNFDYGSISVLISKCIAGGKSINFKGYGLIEKNEIELKYNEGIIQLEFGISGYTHPEKTQYWYQLDNSDWICLGTNTNLTLTELGGGNHSLKYKCVDVYGNASKTQQLSIIIIPPFYQRWWFYTIVILTILGLIYLFLKLKSNNIKKEEKLKTEFNKQLAGAEMKALRAQMNPHFVFNTLNSINKFILKNEQKLASQYLTKFSRLIRLILEGSNQGFTTLENELEMINIYIEMEKMRFQNGFDCEIVVDPKIDVTVQLIPSMILQPYIENAIWHGLLHKNSEGLIKLQFKNLNNKAFLVVIEDNGIGRKKSAELKREDTLYKKSLGTKITKDRIDMINKTYNLNATIEMIDLIDDSNECTGTRVEINLPITVKSDESHTS